MNKFWNWLVTYLPSVFGVVVIGLILTGGLTLMTLFVKLWLKILGVI